MKNTRALIILAIAVLAGLGAVLLAFRWLSDQGASKVARVAVASVEINLGQRISSDMVKLVEWPTGSVPEGSYGEPEKLEGRVAQASLQRGEPILETKLAPVGSQGGLSAVIGKGHRAITVRVNDVIGVAGFALPGNFVDIIVNTNREGGSSNGRDQAISKIVLEKIMVLAVAQEVNRDDTKPRVVNAVTLEVTPEQAEKIDLARSVGTLSLVLRNQVDPGESLTAGMTKEDLLELSANATKARAKEADKAAFAAAKPTPAPTVARKPATTRPPQVQAAPARPAASPKSPMPEVSEVDCVGVLNGVRGSRECY